VGDKLCLCPPSYYGEYCQFQNDRLSIHLAFAFEKSPIDTSHTSIFYRVIATLLNDHHQSVDREEFVLHYLVSNYKHIFYLVYINPDEVHLSYTVRFDIFSINLNSVRFLSTRIVPIPFGFLPVNRLSLRINLVNLSMANVDNSSYSSEMMVCPLGRYGRQCKFQYDPCVDINRCKNGGTCYPFDIRMPNFPFVCLCPPLYFGTQCEFSSARALLKVSRSVQKLLPSITINEIPILMVYLTDIYNGLPKLIIQEHLLYTNVPFESTITILFHRRPILSDFIFAKILYSADKTDYYLVGLHKRSVSSEQTSILASYQCPHVATLQFWSLYNRTGDELNYLASIKLYHRACYMIGLKCFYDKFHICICDNEARLECFLFDHTVGNCSLTPAYCLNGGVCQHSSLSSSNPLFACACQSCFYGDLCQFTTTQYSVSLDALEFHWAILTLVSVFVLIGTSVNSLCIATFIRPQVRQIGCGLYLMTSSIVGQFGLLVFFAKLIHLYGKYMNNQILCIGLEFALTVSLSMFDWLTACIAVERTVSVIKGAVFNRQTSVRAAKYVILALFLFNIITSIHEPLYRRLINDPHHAGQLWCVLDFNTNNAWLSVYEKASNIAHIIGPFLINLFSVLVLLVRLTQRRNLTIGIKTKERDKAYITLFFKHIRRYKHCLISPILLLIFGLPRLVFTFAFVCIEFSWQKQIYMASYLISVLPMGMVFFIFLLPSPDYQTELKKVSLARFLTQVFHRSKTNK
jgi:hypothetical protein